MEMQMKRMILLAVVTAAGLSAFAGERTVSTAAELVSALEELSDSQAAAESVVYLEEGDYDVGPYNMKYFKKNTSARYDSESHLASARVRMIGKGTSPRDVVIYGNRTTRVLIECGGGLENLTISNACWSGKTGGGVYAQGLNATHSNVVVTCCTCQSSGGGVNAGDWYCCQIVSNAVTAGHGGGGTSGKYYNCIISNNVASINAGGLYYGVDAYDCTIVDNVAGGSGGGICGTDAAVGFCRLHGGLVANNSAGTSGGGVYATDVDGGAVISNNVAGRYGGGVYVCGADDKGTNVVVDALVCDNRETRTDGAGGGIYVFGAGIVSNCVIRGNFAAASGGGVYACGQVFDCVVSNNVADVNGGGVYAALSSPYRSLVSGCLIASNECHSCGGGVYASGGNLCDCVISNNCADATDTDNNAYGGGLSVQSSSMVWNSSVVKNCTRNDKYQKTSPTKGKSCYGGGVYGYGGSHVVSNCLIAGNATYPGAVNVQGAGAYGPRLVDCVIRDNFLFGTLGMGLNSGSALRCLFTNNASSAGAPYTLRQNSSIVDCEICGTMTSTYTLKGCRIVNFTNWVYLAEGANVATSGWFNVGGHVIAGVIAATNCLWANNYSPSYYLFYATSTNSQGKAQRFYNCTFADNMSKSPQAASTYPVELENCLFARNLNPSNKEQCLTSTYPENLFLRNCFLSPLRTGAAAGSETGTVTGKPRFVDDGSRDSYALKYSSPARGQGALADWMLAEGECDIRGEGSPRVRNYGTAEDPDLKVDIGCYQCWLDPVGTMLIVR